MLLFKPHIGIPVVQSHGSSIPIGLYRWESVIQQLIIHSHVSPSSIPPKTIQSIESVKVFLQPDEFRLEE